MADISETVEQYLATANYAVAGDVAMAETHLRALRILEVIRPQSLRKGAASQLDYNVESIRRQINDVTRWLQRQYAKNAPEKTYFDVRRSRR
jgi:hypothetical protein